MNLEHIGLHIIGTKIYFFRGTADPRGGKNAPPGSASGSGARQPRGGKTPLPRHFWGGSPWFSDPMGKIDSLRDVPVSTSTGVRPTHTSHKVPGGSDRGTGSRVDTL